MSQGLFRGICERYFYSELFFPSYGEASYSPRGDFTFNLFTAASFAYYKAIEARSQPVVACLMDVRYVGRRHIPLSKVKLIMIAERPGLDELVKFYKKNISKIPTMEKCNIYLLRYLYEWYKQHQEK